MEVKFIKTGEDFSNIATKLRQELRQECVEYLTQATKENGLIEFNLQDDEYVFVSYDGGSHPEYEANLYSMVHSVSFNDDKNRLSIETDDADDYTVDRINTDELYSLALAVYYKLNG